MIAPNGRAKSLPAAGFLTCVLVFLSGCAAGAAAESAPVVRDVFGRGLNERGVTLVDWEGHLANPAIKILIAPPEGAALPARATLSSTEVRLYFDLPCALSARGARKELVFKSKKAVEVLVSIWPDRDTRDEQHALTISFTDRKRRTSSLALPVRVIDQDRERAPVFPIIVDYSQDKTGFFRNAEHRRVIEQATADWAYFLGEMRLAEVPAGAEATWIWSPQGFRRGAPVRNARAYTGYLLYAYGIHPRELRSGGEASHEGGWQRSGGRETGLRCSGGLEMETAGNFNSIGWMVSTNEDDWWRGTNLREVKNDLYSIAHHEMGHSFFFNPGHRAFDALKRRGRITDERVRAYQGAEPKIDRFDHFPGSIDRASRKGIFGYEYYGDVPRCRWIITKLDLLNIQAMGYRLRETSAFRALALGTERLPAGRVGTKYSAKLAATGGIPFYCWDVTRGKLPEGLSLDPFTGEISGTPRRAGRSSFTLRVREYLEGSTGVSRALRLEIAGR